MIRNYFKIAWRNLAKNKSYTVINVGGLAIGMAVALLIGLWMWDELEFNNYHTNHSQLAQVLGTQTYDGESKTIKPVAMPLGNELRSKYASDFKAVSMASFNWGHVLDVGEKQITAEGMWVEPAFPEMFSLKMIHGSQSGLKDPASILLSASVATALFGNEDPMHKVIKVDNTGHYTVTGVYEELPSNTTLNTTKILIPWARYLTTESWLKDEMERWENRSFQAFVQLNDNVDFNTATAKIKDASMVHLNAVKDGREELVLQPMDNWRLRSEFKNGKPAGGRIQYIWLFAMIGTFVLLLACINFMNLSTARSAKRAKEVGIRKTAGSSRKQLIAQFLTEAILVASLALVLSLFLVLLILPFFNELAGKQAVLPVSNVFFWGIIAGFTFFTGIVSGSYPAFYLSGLAPIKVLKGVFRAGRFASLPRRILVVAQFTFSIALIIGTIIVYKQIQFAKDRPLGYTPDGLIAVDMNTPDLYGHYDAIRNDLIATGAVDDMAENSSPLTEVEATNIGFSWEDKDPNSLPLFGTLGVTHDYGKTIGWQILEGRDFSRNFGTDSTAIILNEAAAKLTGLKNVAGKTILWNTYPHQVIGVVKDMIMESPYQPVKPIIFFMKPGWVDAMTIRIKRTVTINAALAKIQTVLKEYDPSTPFEYKFVDSEYAQKFSDEERIGNLSTCFALLAIFISCLGLFGLASFIAEQRTKEIGVRKVLGASVFNLWKLLSKDFVKLVIISLLIAIPVAFWFMHHWLERYHYRTSISWWIFVITGTGALLITLITVSFQAIKAAIANPVKSLRTQ